ncbi:MAG TPA: hypothetical protein VMU05_09425 [Dongiaceae bacterium]|nr:hypothetical protein [Dongiaceae bacterium]
MRNLWLISCLLPIALAAAAAGQEGNLRDPNPQERKILMQYREVIGKVLDQFQSDDWEEKIEYEITDDVSVSGDPDVPLDVNELIQRSYTIRPGSALYEKEVAPLAQKLTATSDPNEMARIAKQRKVTNLSVEVHFNRLCVGMDSAPSAASDLHIPGTAAAYRIKPAKLGRGDAVVLLFGSWKTATWNGDNGCERFKFKHAAHQPAIENVVIQMDGSPERIGELLKTVKWDAVNTALTEKP